MKVFIKIFYIFLRLVGLALAFFYSAWVAMSTGIIILSAHIDKNIDFQIVLLFLISVIAVVVAFITPFLRLKKKYYLLLITYLVIVLLVPYRIPTVVKQLNQNYCVEDGFCPKGTHLKINDEDVYFDGETCLKYGFKWNSEKQYCNLNKK